MMRNRLNRKKNKISKFPVFYFSRNGHFCSKKYQFSMNFHDNSTNKNRKIYFLFASAHCAYFIKVGSKLSGRGVVCIFLVGTEQGNPYPMLLHSFRVDRLF